MSVLPTSLGASGQSDHARVAAAAASLLKEAAAILDDSDLLAIRARLQELIDALDEKISGAASSKAPDPETNTQP